LAAAAGVAVDLVVVVLVAGSAAEVRAVAEPEVVGKNAAVRLLDGSFWSVTEFVSMQGHP
jgi:hypothetical protein